MATISEIMSRALHVSAENASENLIQRAGNVRGRIRKATPEEVKSLEQLKGSPRNEKASGVCLIETADGLQRLDYYGTFDVKSIVLIGLNQFNHATYVQFEEKA